MGIGKYFVGSKDVEYYGNVRIQPLTYQDDEVSGASEVRVVQAQNIKLDYILKEKGLDIHPDKSGYLVYGSADYKDKVKAEIKKDPLMLGDVQLMQRKSEEYLGDIMDERGLEASVDATIRSRLGKVRGSILELTTISQDFRFEVVGGVLGALDIWNNRNSPLSAHQL